MEDGLAFVNAAAASRKTPIPTAAASVSALSAESAPTLSATPADTVAVESTAVPEERNTFATMPPSPPEAARTAAAVGWGGNFGPPYLAIFVDVDSKDTSVGMSCPPGAFLESAFLANLKALLLGGGQAAVGGGGGAGVLAINIAARSRELFTGAVDAVCAAFPGGEVRWC